MQITDPVSYTHLPGHMGAVRVTVQNLSIVKVDAENNLIAIKGAIPGPKGSVVTIHDLSLIHICRPRC